MGLALRRKSPMESIDAPRLFQVPDAGKWRLVTKGSPDNAVKQLRSRLSRKTLDACLKIIRDLTEEDILEAIDALLFLDDQLMAGGRNDIVILSDIFNALQNTGAKDATSMEDYNRHIVQLRNRVGEQTQRLAELIEQQPTSSDEYQVCIPERSRLERLFGKEIKRRFHWLKNGINASGAVCQIVCADGSTGAGFLTDEQYLFTSKRVISDKDKAKGARATFGYGRQESDNEPENLCVYETDADSFSTTDYPDIVRIKLRDNPDEPLKQWTVLSIPPLDNTRNVEVVFSICFGLDRQIRIDVHDRINQWESVLEYSREQKSVSPGSPVFDADWKIMAVHARDTNNVVANHKDAVLINFNIAALFVSPDSPIKAKIQQLVANGQTEEALQKLVERVPDAILLQARYNQGKKQYNMGLIEFGEWSRIQAQVNYAALELAGHAKSNKPNSTSSPQPHLSVNEKERIRELIEKNEMEEALHRLAERVPDAILLQALYNQGKKQYNMGLIEFGEWSQKQAKIKNEALELIVSTKSNFETSTTNEPQSPKKVYISYSHEDRETARKVRSFLHENGLEVIIDEDDLPPAMSIIEFMQQSIRKCDAMISIVSAKSLQSGWVAQELILALDMANNKFIPVRLDDVLFDSKFQIAALKNISVKIQELDKDIEEIKSLGGSARDLQEDRKRLSDLQNNFSDILFRLKITPMTMIQGQSFEYGMNRVLAAIMAT